MRITNVVEFVKPEYAYFRLIPNSSIRNNNTHLVARTVASMYREINKEGEKTVKFWNKEITFPTKWKVIHPGKVGYFVYIEKEKIDFYFMVPFKSKDVFIEKFKSVWPGVTIEQVDGFPSFSESALKYQMSYEKEDGLSLNTNRTSNDLLNASLNIVDTLSEGDKIGIFYNFNAASQRRFRYMYQSTIDKVKNGVPTDRDKSNASYLFKMTLTAIDYVIRAFSEAFAGPTHKNKEDSFMDSLMERLNGGRDLSESTRKKIKGQIVDTQILLLAENKNQVRIKEKTYLTAISQAFEVLSGDNRMVGKAYKKEVDFTQTRFPGVDSNFTFDEEVQNFVALPGRELMEKYPFMEQLKVQETNIPKDLMKGTLCIGEHTIQGVKQKVYLSSDEQFKRLSLVLIGPSRAGKSNLMANLAIDAINNGETVIVMDFIKNCELSDEIASVIPQDKILRITPEDLQGLGYNEINFKDNPLVKNFKESPTSVYENAKRMTSNTLALVNAINNGRDDSSKLTPKMERYLECACLVAYTTGDGSVKDIFDVLRNHETRQKFIKAIPDHQKEFLEDYILSLKELNDTDSKGVINGTKFNLIAGIIDRLNALKRNATTELMLKRGTKGNVNLIEEMQKAQLITLEFPDAKFLTKEEKDIVSTYWITKIWLALQLRGDIYRGRDKEMIQVNIMIDEIYQVPHTQKFVEDKISQIAKYGAKPILSCHYINQLNMRDELRSVNASYMLVSGCDKKNYKEFKEELYPYEERDLLELKRFHSMNYIKCQDGYATFTTKLPGVPSKERKKNP